MQIDYGQGRSIKFSDADQFVMDYMLGLIGQGHGHHTVRGVVPAVKYLRLTHNLNLVNARDAVLAYEAASDKP
jgi:hypothetical protein